jgi:hypothetical protein
VLLAVCVVVCATPGFIVAIASRPDLKGGDGPEYHQIALNLLQHDSFSADQGPPYEPTLFRTPGYPLFLAAIYGLIHESIRAVWIVQVMLFWLSARLVSLIASQLFSGQVALIAGNLTLLYLPLISLVPYHLTEVLSSFLLVCVLGLFLRINSDTSRLLPSALCGVTLALLVLVRPSYSLLFSGLLPFFPWRARRQQVLRNAMCLLLTLAVPLGYWMIRNSLLARRPVGLSTGAGVNLYESALQYAGMISYKKTIPEWQALIAQERRRAEVVRKVIEASGASPVPTQVRYELALDREYSAEAARVLKENGVSNPWANLTRRVAYLWSPSDFSEGWVHAVSRIEHFAVSALVALGCYYLRKRKDVLALLLMPAIYTTLLHLVFQVEGRYSIPARLPLIIVAAYGLGCIRRKSLGCRRA